MLIKIGSAFVDPQEIAMITGIKDSFDDVHPQICVHLRNGGSIWIEATMDEAEAALIDAGVIEFDEPDEEPELTEEEHGVAKALYVDGFRYLARDADGKLYAFDREPRKQGAYWDNDPDPGQPKPRRIQDGYFDFVDSGDEKPWSIAYLLPGA